MHFVRPSVCPSITFRVAITYVCINGLPSNLVQMLSSLRQCAVTLTFEVWIRVKVTAHLLNETFKGQSTHARVRAVTYVCIAGLPSN